jgi:hypothetical protein
MIGGSHPNLDGEIDLKNVTLFRSLNDQPFSKRKDIDIDVNKKIIFSMRIQLPFNLNIENKKNLDEQTKFINFILASSVALPVLTGTSFISFLLYSKMQNVWYILNALQLASFLLMINVRFPFHTKFS